MQLARAGRYDESMTFMEQVLQRQGNTHFDFLALSAAETDPDTRAGLLQSFNRLQSKYPDNSQLQFGKALLLQQDGQQQKALELLEQQPSKDRPIASILLHARLLQSLERNDDALPLLEKGIEQHPDDKRLRLTYARLLVAEDRLDEAKDEFASLLQQYPATTTCASPWRWSAWKPKPGRRRLSTWKNWSSAAATAKRRTTTWPAPTKNWMTSPAH